MTVESLSLLESQWNLDSPTILDDLERRKSYLLSGENGAQVKLSASAYSLLRAIRSGMSFAELAETLNARHGAERVSEEQLKSKYEALVAELDRAQMQSARNELPWGFWVRLRLVPEAITARFAQVFSPLFNPAVAACLVAGMIAVAVLAARDGFTLSITDTAFLAGAGIFLLTLLGHEFGHATACARYGARPSDIGFTAYLIYPAFYSDVSSAWRLTRLQRVVVDLGGCYFQGILTAVLAVAYLRTGWEALHVAIVFSLYSALFSLNPVFKFDGYWVLADLLGVSNLARQPKRIRRYVFNRMLGRPAEQLPWPSSITGVLVLYSCVTVVVWSYFVLRLIPMLAPQCIAVAHAVTAAVSQVGAGALPAWHSLNTIFSSGAFLVLILLMLWNIVKVQLYTAYFARKRHGRPVFRG